MNTLPHLDMTAPGFSTKGPEMHAARAAHWCARTPFGLAVLRHRQVGQLLRDRRLRQGSHAWPDHMGLTGPFAAFWQRSIISQEGTPHKALRQVALSALAPDHIAALIPDFTRIADDLCNRIADAPCDFVDAFTEPFAGRAITTLLGLPDDQAEWIARDASALGLAMGPDCKRHEAKFNAACTRLSDLARDLLAHSDHGLVARMRQAANGTDIDPQALVDLVVIAIFGGVDTTRAQLGFAATLFARHPDQWQALRADPDLIPQAIEEVIRAWPTTTWASREAVEDFEFDGVQIAAGTTLHMLVHASGTDPALAPDWQFDITRPRKSHFGFGGGAHHCLGQLVARTDMACALRALSRFSRIEFAGTPEWLPDSGNTSPAHLPLRFVE